MNHHVKVDEVYAGFLKVNLLTGKELGCLLDAKLGMLVAVTLKGDTQPTICRVTSQVGSGDRLNLASRRNGHLGKFYLAGPMRGMPLRNFPAFLTAGAYLRTLGFDIVCPAQHDLERGVDMKNPNPDAAIDETGLGWDFEQITKCAGIILLDGWENSVGAKAERLVAEMTGKQILRLNTNLELFAEDGWKSELKWSPPLPVVRPPGTVGSVYRCDEG